MVVGMPAALHRRLRFSIAYTAPIQPCRWPSPNTAPAPVPASTQSQPDSASAAGYNQPFPSREFAKPTGGVGLCSVCVAQLFVEHCALEHDRFFDHARHEGDTLGQNDKGLITRDRSNHKRQLLFLPGQLERAVAKLGQYAGPVYFRSHLDRPHDCVDPHDCLFKHRRADALITVYRREPWCRWSSTD